jgi:hypothetical protein
MSYQTYHQGQSIQQFIPNYVVRSDFLPTRVVEGNQGQTAQWVNYTIILDQTIWIRKKKRKSVHTKTCLIQS